MCMNRRRSYAATELGKSSIYMRKDRTNIAWCRLGDPTPFKPPQNLRNYRVEYHDQKGVTFIFKYRPRGESRTKFKQVDHCMLHDSLLAFLEARGIIQLETPAQEVDELRYIATSSKTKRKRQSSLHSNTIALEAVPVGVVKSEIEEEGEEESIEVLEVRLSSTLGSWRIFIQHIL